MHACVRVCVRGACVRVCLAIFSVALDIEGVTSLMAPASICHRNGQLHQKTTFDMSKSFISLTRSSPAGHYVLQPQPCCAAVVTECRQHPSAAATARPVCMDVCMDVCSSMCVGMHTGIDLACVLYRLKSLVDDGPTSTNMLEAMSAHD